MPLDGFFVVNDLRKFVIKAKVDYFNAYEFVYYITCLQVNHSQRISCTPLLPWVVIEQDGSVAAAHCTCMAGYIRCTIIIYVYIHIL